LHQKNCGPPKATETYTNKKINYARNNTGAITSVGTDLIGDDPNATINVANTISYRGFGKLRSLVFGNGRSLTLGYSNQRQWLANMLVRRTDGSDTIINNTYSYFTNHRLQQITDNVNPAYSVTYGYDSYNRLTAASWGDYPAKYRGYSYDEWGNLRTVSGAGGEAANYTLNYATNASGAPATNRISDVSGTAYGYDAAGNLTSEGATTTYTYDAANRMKTATTGSNQTSYGYDGDGKKVRRNFTGLLPLYFVYSSVLGQVAMEVRQGLSLLRAFVYSGGKQMGVWSVTNFYWMHLDHSSSTHKMTRADGSVAYQAEYDPHGQMLFEWADAGVYPNDHKFTGYERDYTGLDYAQARMYHHNRGRFVQSDPLGSGYGGQSPKALASADQGKPQSLNRYSYVENDPVNFTDPTGLLIPVNCGDPGDPGSGGGDPGDGGGGPCINCPHFRPVFDAYKKVQTGPGKYKWIPSCIGACTNKPWNPGEYGDPNENDLDYMQCETALLISAGAPSLCTVKNCKTQNTPGRCTN